MKILPAKKDLDKVKSQERKLEIDNGMALAKRIDALRETKDKEEQQLREWREGSVNKVKEEIAVLVYERDTLKKQNEQATIKRDELLKPLTTEWALVDKAKAQLAEDKQKIWEEKEFLDKDKADLEKEKQKISKIVSRVTQNEKDTEKAKQESISLRELAQKEYEIARDEHISQTKDHEKAMSTALQLQKEYEVGLSLITIRENEVKEREEKLLVDIAHLESGQAQLRRAIEITQNGSNNI